jgi:hypothetical protein
LERKEFTAFRNWVNASGVTVIFVCDFSVLTLVLLSASTLTADV